jgi:hypothetical protein
MSVPTPIDGLLLTEKYKPLLAAIKALRNGAIYAGKVRFAHTLTMTILYQKGEYV